MNPLSNFAIDPRSVIVLTGVMSLVMSLVMFFLYRSAPPGVRGLREWMLAPAVCVVATLLVGARGLLPDLLSIVAGNMVVFQGALLFYAASQCFLDGRRDTRGWTAVTLALGPVMAWYTYVQPSYGARLVVATSVTSLLFTAHLRLYLRHGMQGFGRRFMVGVLCMEIVVLLGRLAAVFTGSAGSTLMDPTWIQALYIGMNALTVLLLSVGGIVLATDRVRAEFQYLARHDTLTGVLNRGALMDVFEAAVERARRQRTALSVLLLDLDHFKAVNDTHGHQAGDRVLQDFVAQLQGMLRAPDTLGRYGGEEFVVLLPGTELRTALGVAERIRSGIETSPGMLRYTVSIGVTELRRTPGETMDTLLARADQALYEAKRAGRNQTRSA
ncbi:GGDEF domain-containing protein [Xylophilus sp.]|uniref:GGDEF domain-containing protein n=1 Tax=Xylophilus sp. TaxID=2653893 RepID=UPI002D7EB04A|nr:GGDEF domain-containing protein [Xylophilus sp.]